MRTMMLKRIGVLIAGMTLIVSGNVQAAEKAPHAPFVTLAPENAELFRAVGTSALDDPASGRVPNYLRALATTHPDAVKSFATLFKTVLYGGTVEAETKAAMGLRIAQANGSDYLAAHLKRILNTSERGRTLLTAAPNASALNPKERIALKYAADLTQAIHGVSDTEFAQARTVYNDAQLVELTATTYFFNYFARFCQGAGLPLETWATETPNGLSQRTPGSDDAARVTLASDAELQMAAKLANPSPELKKGLGIGVANSQRAMVRVPDIGDAWWQYWQTVRTDTKLSRETQLHISFAVSMLNGCRYCTLHQVAGLRRLGVEPAKLLAMKKDDSALNAKELAAVTFARKLSAKPKEMQETDFTALRSGLGSDNEAMDALLQTCAFNFMNRFTDGLRLPSEDEAIKVYQEVYGEGAYRAFPHGAHSTGAPR